MSDKIFSEEEALKASLEYFSGDELAAKVFINKYALRNRSQELLEKTPDDMHRRLAREFARAEAGKFKKPFTEDQLFEFFKGFNRIVPQGSPMYGVGNIYQIVSLSNCYVADSPLDSYGGILHTDQQIAQVSKRRGGVGTDISNLRPAGAATSNAARSSTGILPFMERYSNTIREVGQSGRRGALLTSISVHHPEVLTFAAAKRDKNKVTGANLSIRFTDEFLKAVEKGVDYEQRWPVDKESADLLGQPFPVVSKMVSAKKVWDTIVEIAHATAEPGILFWDNIIRYGVADSYASLGFKTTSTNPCLTGDTLVRLASGGHATIKELAEKGNDVDVLCLDDSANICVRKMRNPRKTGIHLPVYRITLEGGHSIRVTENHIMLLGNGDYKEAGKLTDKDTLWCNLFDLNSEIRSAKKNKLNNNEEILIEKHCENCGDPFVEEYANRETSFCGPICHDIYYAKKSGFKKTAIPKIKRRITSFQFDGYEDVYDGTVDEFHNFFCGGFKEDNKYMYLNNLNCGELPLCSADSCRLLVLNLCYYVRERFTKKAYFDFAAFFEDVKIAQRLMDDLIDLELEALDKIISKIKKDPEPEYIKRAELEWWKKVRKACHDGRRTGTGITALGDTLAFLGIKYGTEESIKFTSKIYQTLKLGSYVSSIEMAKELGHFEIWDHNLEKDNEFLKRFEKDELDLGNGTTIKGQDVLHQMKKYGRRNIACNTTAPAGSVSLLTQTTSGIEPLFMISFTRRKKINVHDKDVKVDFVDDSGDQWQEFTVYHPRVKEWMQVTGETDIKKSPWYGACAEELKWSNRVILQSKAQYHLDHSISSTVNLPEDVSVADVQNIYETAWKAGCKGITVYRKNCRTGVLIEKKEDEKEFKSHNAPKRPKSLPCDVYYFKAKGKHYVVFVGLLCSKPYEVFAYEGDEKPKQDKGFIQKLSRGKYRMVNEQGETILENIRTVITPEEAAISRLASTSLRHGADVAYVVQQCEKVEGGLLGFTACIARALKKYIKDGTKVTGDQCGNCKSTNLIRNQGCVTCADCGWSKC